MNNPYRAMCSELVEQVQRAINNHGLCLEASDALMHRARALLAEPEAEGPTDEELRDLWSWAAGQDQGPWPTQYHCFARAVLARFGGQR